MILCFWYAFCLPSKLFEEDYSTVLFSSNHQLLGATIATDEQWRFPPSELIPEKFKICLLNFEDEYFYKHPGFNPISMGKAILLNLRKKHTVRGGSTLTQQVIRLSRKQHRTYLEKFIELIWATRLELKTSKDDILKLYMHHAPYGGNVVGLEMASWRYFGTSPDKLSWAESATLAVLPNAPSLIFPGKNKSLLKKKRDFLLTKLKDKGLIDDITYQLSLQESIPRKPVAIPIKNIHLLSLLDQREKGKRWITSIDSELQDQALETAKKYYQQYQKNNIHNLAILVLDNVSKKVLAYVGNSPTLDEHHKYVDMIQAQRSTGSTLKPILYMAMLSRGELMPNQLIADIPTQIQEYNPQNFDYSFSGAVSASKVISRSLNVPSVRMLRDYGLQRFYDDLQRLKLKTVNKSIDYYGLTLILGGAESTLWDLTNMYASLASTLTHYNKNESNYFTNEHQTARFLKNTNLNLGTTTYNPTIFDAGSIFLGFKAMTEVTRPEDSQEWKHYTSSQKIAWKTGTSFGNKDAWSIGVNKNYTVGVWVGNADGEGIANMTGVQYAAPIMFDTFEMLPKNEWFETPLDGLQKTTVCKISGHKPNPYCPTKTQYIPLVANSTLPCPYHQTIYLDKKSNFRVFKNCVESNQITSKTFFVLPPNQAWYYKKFNPDYVPLPPIQKECLNSNTSVMDFLSPNENTSFILAKDFDEKTNPIVIKVTHQRNDEKLFWYIDDAYIKTTKHFHEIAIAPTIGKHKITVVDQNGNQISRTLNIE
ncbi:penicillin-binding protein 1C [Wenyingzhuangia sp. 1_MG-2023]|nr:penicillin-binding protein 1C [Wenyingzhuangia sp. 1_MG-2023]